MVYVCVCVRAWRWIGVTVQFMLGYVDSCWCVCPIPIPASSDHKARLWNVDQASAIREFSGHQKAIVALAYRE